MRALAFDYAVVPLMGVPLNRIAALTFAIGSGLAAVAGILISMVNLMMLNQRMMNSRLRTHFLLGPLLDGRMRKV